MVLADVEAGAATAATLWLCFEYDVRGSSIVGKMERDWCTMTKKKNVRATQNQRPQTTEFC